LFADWSFTVTINVPAEGSREKILSTFEFRKGRVTVHPNQVYVWSRPLKGGVILGEKGKHPVPLVRKKILLNFGTG